MLSEAAPPNVNQLVVPGTEAVEAQFDVAAFLRVYQMRSQQIMWFFGAGASRAAGIPTAGDMIWDFKQRLYRSEKKLAPSAITDLGDPMVRQKLQQYFDSSGRYPIEGAADEYSAYFEATYQSPKDRRAYLETLIARGKPSFGHLALGLLMQQNLARIVWSTNFDRTIEDAAFQTLGGTGRLVVADLGGPTKLRTAIAEARWPLYGKLHGDYHSEQLKNTADELRAQDEAMCDCLIQSCKSNGLAVVGYSGRDASVMDALDAALDDGKGFPGGLFWFKRWQDSPCQAVEDLLTKARGLGVDAHLVDNESFDELLSDVVRFLPETSERMQTIKGVAPPRLVAAQLRASSIATPVIRTNALPLVSHPVMCRLVECSIGGWNEIRDAIEAAGVDIDAQRCRDGVLAFGRDADIRTDLPYFIGPVLT
jgi:NAD-dependent SIR2 family protein deacetylase